MNSIVSSNWFSTTWRELQGIDRYLQMLVVALLFIGFIAMVSASVEHAAGRYGDAFFFAKRYFLHFGVGLTLSLLVYLAPVAVWERSSWLLLLIGFLLL